jgi:AcrR family transcriptional regulator
MNGCKAGKSLKGSRTMDDQKPTELMFDIDAAGMCPGQGDAQACSGKKRGRPRAFCTDAVLDTTLELFWMKGFTATSLDDIAAATGVSRPSLFAAFGDKEAMYIKAMERYQEGLRQQLDGVLTCNGEGDSMRAIIDRYFDIMISAYTGESDHPLGCAFMCTALNEAPQHESILEMLQATIEGFDRRFQSFFEGARYFGCLRPDQDPKILTQIISGLTSNLLMRARAGAGRKELTDIARATTAFLFP